VKAHRLRVNFGGMQIAGAYANLGIAHYTACALTALREGGAWAVDGVADDAVARTYRAADLDWVDTMTPRSALGGGGLGGALWRGISARRGAESLRSRPDAEYLPHPFAKPLGAPRAPTLLCCFDLFVVDAPEKYGRHLESRRGHYAERVALADAIVVPFPRTFRLLPSVFPAAQGKLFRTACPTLLGDVPLREDLVRSVAARFRPDPAARLVLYPSALHQHKNHAGLIAAAALLVERGRRVTFVCPGSEHSPETTEPIRAAIRSFEMAEHVLLPGFLRSEEVRALYEICDLAISPSRAEGGNAIVQEAIHFGRPVACAGIEAAREHVQAMGAAVPFFDPDDPHDMARAVEEVLQDPGRHVAANARARETIRSWTWRRLAQRYAEILDWLVQGADPGKRPPTED
jgi:glycosyltransferase involved in cell wall biosynthesis